MPAKWFERFNNCQADLCTRKATGVLRDERNGEMGKFCDKCAQARLAAARSAAKSH